MKHEDYFIAPKFLQEQWYILFARILAYFIILVFLILVLVPWVQNSQGDGTVIALDPNDRIQSITALVSGRIEKWHVTDGSVVKKGDPLVEVIDNDPNFVERLRTERDAQLRKYQASKLAAETAAKDYQRQKELFKEGLSSQVKSEMAKIKYQKLLSEEATAAASLAKAEISFSRQQNQLILAPSDGTILRVKTGSGNILVNEGDEIAVFVPAKAKLVAEVYVDGNDLPLITEGRKVRLQFEGWPAVQFSGWPSVAVGTFQGVVLAVDTASSMNGKFRVLVGPTKDTDWPGHTFLRQGTRVHAWILLDTVKIGFELWRTFNGFPLSATRIIEEDKSERKKKTEKKK